jgi:hypothetical protein
MNPAELLGLLTAKVQRFQVARKGLPTYTSEDVSHALGLIESDEARLYARVKYAGQVEYAEGIVLAIRRQFMIRKGEQGWRTPRPMFLWDMSCLVLAEAIDPQVCLTCGGRKQWQPERGPLVNCPACRGNGFRTMYEKDRAELLDIWEANWSTTWSHRYRDGQINTVDVWEQYFQEGVRTRLKEPQIAP